MTPIPSMLEEGLLPTGIHDCSVIEVKDRFGKFQKSDQRCQLFSRLESFIEEVRKTKLIVEVIIDGSFVTSKDEPGDVDLVVVLSAEHDVGAEILPCEYNLLSNRRVRKRYGFDILVAQEGHPEHAKYIEFFMQVKGKPDFEKGVLRIRL